MIYFKHPEALWCLFILILPILVHLFNFRKYVVRYFSSLKFVETAQVQTKKASELKKRLLLFSRLLLLFFGVLAFAQPALQEESSTENKNNEAIAIVIDNSPFMNIRLSAASGKRVFDQAKEDVYNFLKTLPKDSKVVLIGSEKKYEPIEIKKAKELVNDLADLEITYNNDLEHTLQRLNLFEEQNNLDLRCFLWSIKGVELDQDLALTWIKLHGSDAQNYSIDSIELSKPIGLVESDIHLKATIRNHTRENAKEIPISLSFDKKQYGAKKIDVSSSKSMQTEFEVQLEKEFVQGKLSVQDDDFIEDNIRYFVLQKTAPINVVILTENKSVFTQIYSSVDKVNVKEQLFTNYEISSLETAQLIVVDGIPNESLVRHLIQIQDEKKIDIALVLSDSLFLENRASFRKFNLGELGEVSVRESTVKPNLQLAFFDGVFKRIPENPRYPKVFKTVNWKKSRKKVFQDLIAFPDGSPFLSMHGNDVKTYLFNTSLSNEWTDFTQNSLIVPVALKMVENTIKNRRISFQMNEDIHFTHAHHANCQLFVQQDSLRVPIYIDQNVQQHYLSDEVKQLLNPGYFTIKCNNEMVLNSALNFDQSFADLKHFVTHNNQNIIDRSDFKTIVSEDLLPQTPNYWKLCIIFALVFMFVEAAILRWM